MEASVRMVMKVGAKYNWIGQLERLIYLGKSNGGFGRWHQFAKVDCPSVIWCEVLDEDLPKPLLQGREAVQRQKLNSLRADVKSGMDELDEGCYTIFDQNFVDNLLAETEQASNRSA